jgi:hypothetical protein
MMGCYYELKTCLRHDVHVLINTYYIAHRKALLACDQTILELLILDQFAN